MTNDCPDLHRGPCAAGAWIPVRERMPDNDRDVWLWCAGRPRVGHFDAVENEWCIGGRADPEKVTHWAEIASPGSELRGQRSGAGQKDRNGVELCEGDWVLCHCGRCEGKHWQLRIGEKFCAESAPCGVVDGRLVEVVGTLRNSLNEIVGYTVPVRRTPRGDR